MLDNPQCTTYYMNGRLQQTFYKDSSILGWRLALYNGVTQYMVVIDWYNKECLAQSFGLWSDNSIFYTAHDDACCMIISYYKETTYQPSKQKFF